MIELEGSCGVWMPQLLNHSKSNWHNIQSKSEVSKFMTKYLKKLNFILYATDVESIFVNLETFD